MRILLSNITAALSFCRTIRVNSKRTNSMVRELILGLTASATLVNGKRGKWMALVSFSGRMVFFIVGNMRRTCVMVGAR